MSRPDLVQIGDVSRRDVLRGIALALTASAAGRLDEAAAQEVHRHVSKEKEGGGYQPKLFNAHEYRTVARLAELIIPADDTSGSAAEAGAPEFIDVLCSQNDDLAHIYRGGLAWLDARMRQHHNATFAEATEMQQAQMLDVLFEAARSTDPGHLYGDTTQYPDFQHYAARDRSEESRGVAFFRWTVGLTMDAFYTSPTGFKDLGYLGNIGMQGEYKVPKEAIEDVLRRSPLGNA